MSQTSLKKELWIILSLIAFSIALRLPTLESPLIEDEAISFNRYIDIPWQDLILNYHDTNQHTFFLLFSKFSIWIFGESEIAFRLPSFLAGVLSIPLIYKLGLQIKVPWPTALTSALLMSVSWPHLKYSLEGRGYALTIFLVTLATYSAIKYLNTFRLVWGSILIASGVAMTMALPSNLFFLCGLGIFIILTEYLEAKKIKLSIKSIPKGFTQLFIMLSLIGVYFLTIYEGLKLGKQFNNQALTWDKIENITEFIAAPWGFWIYLFFALGLWQLQLTREKILFLSVLLVPIFLTLVTGVVGFDRTYIYWLPFVLLLSASGITYIFLWVFKKIGKFTYVLGLIFILLLFNFSNKKITKHYEDRSNGSLVVAGPNATLSEASQLAIWVEENIPEDNLIVLSTGGPESSVLIRYMGEKTMEHMIYFARGGELKKLIFISHQGMPPENYSFTPWTPDQMLRLPASRFNKIYSLGNLGVYELNLQVKRFIPSRFDPDYELKLGTSEMPQVNIQKVEEPRVVGKHALFIENKSGVPMDIISPVIKGTDIWGAETYLLYLFIKSAQQKGGVHLGDNKNWPPTLGFLNPWLGRFRTSSSSYHDWHIKFSLSSLSKGRHYFQERIGIQKGISYFDGFQSYLLTE
ncbi:MAG: hypothetical protein HN474_02985 [Nitrospina sp.]|nr:hypothetical protein [Nitrospina sp.]